MKKKRLLIIPLMVISYIFQVELVLASAPPDNTYGIISVNGATSVEEKSDVTEIVATYENGSVSFTGTGLYSLDGNIYSKNDVTVDCTANENYTCSLMKDGVNSNGSTISLNNLVANDVINVDAIFSGNQVDLQNAGNTTASITVSAGTGTYEISRPNIQTGQSQVVQENYDDMIEFSINGSRWNPGDNTISYDANNTDTTVEFTFETLWINRYYENIVINGDSYPVIDYINFDDRTSWLEHNHGEQTVSFSIPNVPKASSYNIVAKHGENNGTRFIATFLWTSDPEQAGTKDYIGNSTLEFVKAKYVVGGVTYIVTAADIKGHETIEGDQKVFRSVDGFLNYGVKNGVDYDDGSLTLPGEAEVTMRVVPMYGYQVTSVNGGKEFNTTDEGVSEFTVIVHNGEAGYFQAEVTKVANEVKTDSEKVSAGTVAISDGEIDSGTVRLYVSDIELSKDKIKGFEDAAGEYTIDSYLDINLSQVFYKGNEDGSDTWDEEIHKLNKNATISLKLAPGVDINDIVIVHNIDNGDKYEIIEIDSYNPETRVVKFRTKSFSNYAIAYKTVEEEPKTNNPETNDNSIIYISLLGLSMFGIIGTSIYNKKKELN